MVAPPCNCVGVRGETGVNRGIILEIPPMNEETPALHNKDMNGGNQNAMP